MLLAAWGFLSKNDRQWKIADDRMHKSLLAGRIQANQIPAEKIVLHAPQKGVDMKLGLDITTDPQEAGQQDCPDLG